jgi:hypothetical protein
MDIYVDIFNKSAMTSDTDATPAPRPDFRTPVVYPVNVYFMRLMSNGVYSYADYEAADLQLTVREDQPPDFARFSLTFLGYETAEIDAGLSVDAVQSLVEALPSVGVGNIKVSGNSNDGWTMEFIGIFTGQLVSPMVGRVVSSTPPSAEVAIDVLPRVLPDAGSATALPNSQQLVRLRRAPLASTTVWTKTGIGTTPTGWTSMLDMTAVPLSVWDRPRGNILLELVLSAEGTRTGTDGLTVSDGVGRTIADGAVSPSLGATGQTANVSDTGSGGVTWLVANDSNGIYGQKFVPGDVGRVVIGDGNMAAGTTIVEVIDDGVINAARLSIQMLAAWSNPYTYNTGDLPTDVFYSASANWTQADLSHLLTGTNVAPGTRIIGVTNSQYVRLSSPMTALSGSGYALASDISNIFNVGTAGTFTAADVGATLRAPSVLSADATIIQFIDGQNVMLSLYPSAALGAISWTCTKQRAYPPPGIISTIAGTNTSAESQWIALPQIPTAGTITFQDGYGGSMPIIEVATPVTAGKIQNGLAHAYPNYGSMFAVQEVVAGAEWLVTWGVNGPQRQLIITDANAIYENAILSWVIVDGVGVAVTSSTGRTENPLGSPPAYLYGGLKYIGVSNASWFANVSKIRKWAVRDGTGAWMCSFRRIFFADTYNPLPKNTAIASGFYLVSDSTVEEKAGLITVTLVGATIPAARSEIHNESRTFIGVEWQYKGGITVDIQFVSVSQSRAARIDFTYNLSQNGFVQPADSPAGAVLHFFDNLYAPVIVAKGGFPTAKNSNGTWTTLFYTSWSRRRWQGDIWEQQAIYG